MKTHELIAVYGTLKKGFGLHSSYMRNASFLGETVVFGAMQTNGAYPSLFERVPIDFYRDYVVEVYSIPVEDFKRIENMEVGAGYYVGNIVTQFGLSKIFWRSPKYFDPSQEIISKFI